MPRSFLASVALVLATATGSSAFEIEAMSDQERAVFQAEIRAYLLENPEVIMEAVQVLEQRRNQQAQASEQQMLEENRAAIFDDGYSYVGGNPDGDVTIVEFLDYRCGFCKKAFPEVEELIETDGNIRFIVKEFPILGPDSELGSRYAIATKMTHGDESYKRVHDMLMLLGGPLNEASLVRVSRDLALDHSAILAKMDDAEITRIITENRALAQRLEIQGTPTFVMGDNFVRGYVDLDQMQRIVEVIRSENG